MVAATHQAALICSEVEVIWGPFIRVPDVHDGP
jgi:hypothetical protein